ncbi:uncharacterized, partial [Tachysurus ichikawai]
AVSRSRIRLSRADTTEG